MPPVGNNQPAPERIEKPRRFSPETVETGNKIIEGASFFDEKYSFSLRIMMSAHRLGLIGPTMKFIQLPPELQQYIAFRIKKMEEEKAEIEAVLEKDHHEKMFGTVQQQLDRIDPEDEEKRLALLQSLEEKRNTK